MKKKGILMAVFLGLIILTAVCIWLFWPRKIKLDVLIMPVFEIGEMYGDAPGEAQYFYENYFMDSKALDIGKDGICGKLYISDDKGLFLLGQGKVSSAINLTILLEDDRFDWSDTYFICTGCAGAGTGESIVGDVGIMYASFDYDLGHHFDIRESENPDEITWIRMPEYDDMAYFELNGELCDWAYELTKDTILETTELSRECLERNYDGDWYDRPPMVIKGTSATADNYWKGSYDSKKAFEMSADYGAKYPYTSTDMEDIAVARVLKNYGYEGKFLVIRDAVDMDTFVDFQTPQSLWENSVLFGTEGEFEGFDIFEKGMKNNFVVTRIIIDELCNAS